MSEQILRLTVLGSLALTASLTAIVTPFAVPERHLVAIQTLPLQIGDWSTVSEQPVDASVQSSLPTARILDRTYRDKNSGDIVDVLLVTATAVEDIHKPTSCLPAQGWDLSESRRVLLGSQLVTRMKARNEAKQSIEVGYFLTGYYPPTATHGSVIDDLISVRNHAVGTDKSMSLFVRVIADSSPDSDDVAAFISAAAPSIGRIAGGSSADANTGAASAATTGGRNL